MNKHLKNIYTIFTRVKTAIIIIILIAFISIFGTIIPQNQAADKYIELYGPLVGNIVLITDIDNVYHTWYFLLLLTALIINITVCSYKRLIHDFNRVFYPDLDKKISSFEEKVKVKLKYDKALPVLLSIFKKKRFKIHVKKASAQTNVLLQKNIINAFGSHITHISIIIILIGSSLGAVFGYEFYLKILKDQIIEIPRTEKKIRLDKFTVKFYPKSRMASLYRSAVSVIDKNNEIEKEIIEVNKPLNIDGIQFSQNSYGNHGFDHADFEIKDQETGKSLGNHHLKLGQQIELSDSYKLKVEEYIPDLRIGADKKIFTASQEPNNPAIRFSVSKNGKSKDFWTFLKFPMMGSHKKTRFAVKFLKIEPAYYSILQAKSDPGLEIVLFGFILMTIGVFAIYIINYYRISIVLVKSSANATMVQIKGASGKNKAALKNKIQQLVSELNLIDK